MVDCLIFTGVNRRIGYCKTAGPYRIATSLRHAGYSVQVVDYFADWTLAEIKQILSKFVDRKTLWIGFSTTFFLKIEPDPNLQFSNKHLAFTSDFPFHKMEMREIIEYAYKLNPYVKFVMGGSKTRYHTSPLIDFYVEGYADETVVQLTNYLAGKSASIESTRSNFFPDSYVIKSTPKNEQKDLTIEWLPQDLVEYGEALPIEISRGCIFHCTYCNYPLNGKKPGTYIKDSEVLYQELMQNYDRYGTTGYIFSDDTHNDSKDKLMALKQVYDKLPFQMNFVTYLRADLLSAHPETISILEDSGLRSAFFGIETFNQADAKIIGKGMNVERMQDFLYKLYARWQGKITYTLAFIFGLPNDSLEQIEEFYKWANQPNPPFDRLNLYPLGLNKNSRPDLANEFELNFHKYGYYFDEQGNWIKKDMTYKEAAEKANSMFDNLIGKFKYADFSYMFLRNVGASHQDLVTKTVKEYKIEKITNSSHKERYKERLLAL
jgi:radical SAM superfamily enzyme YgiQ (UPF0313 family)